MGKLSYFNQEHYPDPTAYEGTNKVIQYEVIRHAQVGELIDILKLIIHESGFELCNRIELKDIRSGRVYR